MSLCPNNPVHFVKNVFFSYNLNYDFCTICKDDISNIAKSKKIQIKRGQLADLNDNKLSIDLRGETNKIPAHLICGIEKSGKSFLTHTLIYEHQQSHPDAQVIILTENDLYQNLVIDFHGNYFDDSDAIYFSEVFNGPLSVLNIGKNSSYIDSFISGLMNYATTSRPVDKILFVLDIEKALEKTKDLDTLMMAILYASSYNFCFFWVNSDPFFSNFRYKHHINKITSIVNDSAFLCGQTEELVEKIIKNCKLTRQQETDIRQVGNYLIKDQVHRKTFFHYRGKNKSSKLFLHKIRN